MVTGRYLIRPYSLDAAVLEVDAVVERGTQLVVVHSPLASRTATTPRDNDGADRATVPGYGNMSAWDAGTRFDFENPEYRA
jgi:hypothetical protein